MPSALPVPRALSFRAPWTLWGGFIAATLGIIAAGYFYYISQKERILADAQKELEAVAELKVRQIAQWRDEREQNAASVCENKWTINAVKEYLQASQASKAEKEKELLVWMNAIQRIGDYRNCILVDAQGHEQLGTSGFDHYEHFETDIPGLVAEAMAKKKPLLSDFHSGPAGDIHLDLIAPLFVPQDKEMLPVGALLLTINPQRLLYPLIQEWPVARQSEESLLIERQGEEVVFLNELRYRAGSALKLRLPLALADLPAARAVLGQMEFMAGHDYRGVPVFSMARPIAGSPWALVVKLDQDEIYASLRRQAKLLGLLMGTLVLAAALGAGLFWRRMVDKERIVLLKQEAEAREAAQAASRAKDEFLAMLSHELRTPLTTMLMWVKMLLSGKMNETQLKHGLEVIERNTATQAKLIEDLLEIARITSGKLVLDVHEVDLNALVKASVQSVRLAAESKGIQLDAKLIPEPCIVRGDPHRLQQVVFNLLTNAIKFTPKGGKVKVSLERPGSQFRIAVTDTGIGMEPDFLPYVFERFRQADTSITRQYKGLGLGLSIVRHLVELHGGTVAVDSAGKDQGATFTVKLPVAPLRQGQPVTPGPVLVGANGSTLRDLKVLLVEDEPDSREVLAAFLKEYGMEVAQAGNSEEALALYSSFKPGLLLSDIGLPQEDGYMMIVKMRARGMRIPAIALTAYARSEDRARALNSGFQAHVAKPVSPGELAAVIEDVMSGKFETVDEQS